MESQLAQRQQIALYTPTYSHDIDPRFTQALVLIQDALPEWKVEIHREITQLNNPRICGLLITGKRGVCFSSSAIIETLERTQVKLSSFFNVNPFAIENFEPAELVIDLCLELPYDPFTHPF